MFDFSAWLDLPLIWGILIATAVLLYVLLDGFDLGCGILFPFAPSDSCRAKIMNSIAPFWDGNETWLILAGGGLLAVFPLAYAILMPALYLPVIFMLLGLIFRGVAFEFAFKSEDKNRQFWYICFHAGSVLASFMQGVILGNFVQGIRVVKRAYGGTPLDWANGFSITTGICLIFGYALLGATWLIMKTNQTTQQWARKAAKYVLVYVGIGVALVSIVMPLLTPRIKQIWFVLPNFFYLLPIPVFTVSCFALLFWDLNQKAEYRPFLTTLLIFLLCYIGFGISLFPWIVPFHYTLWQAAAAPTSLSLLLVGALIFLPIILGYTGYCYYVFRGKSSDEKMY